MIGAGGRVGRVVYALLALGATGAAAWFAYRQTEDYFILNEVPLPFERFGIVAALGTVCLTAGFLLTLYRLIFEFEFLTRRKS